MEFDPLATARRALWIGGGQWAGKSSVAVNLALRHGLVAYLYDRHDAHGHDDRRVADRVRRGENAAGPDLDSVWVRTDPASRAPRRSPDWWPSTSRRTCEAHSGRCTGTLVTTTPGNARSAVRNRWSIRLCRGRCQRRRTATSGTITVSVSSGRAACRASR